MTRNLGWGLTLAALVLANPAAAQNCRIHKQTGKCINVPASQQVKPDYAVGEDFPIYDHSMLVNIDRYGLPPVDGMWRYYKSGHHIYKVDAQDHRVLDIVKTVRR